MGKNDEKQTKKRARKATGTSKHAATGESKLKKQPSFDTLGSRLFERDCEDNDGGSRDSRWRDLFRQLCEYKVQFGDCLVPARYSTNPKLGNWVSNQRTRYRKNTEEKSTSTRAEYIRALNGIGFDWGTSETDSASIWNERLTQMLEFKVQFGHCVVPRKYPVHPKLHKWVWNQRSHYKLYREGKQSQLTTERIRELDNVGFKWEAHKDSWNERFDQIFEFKVQFGHCLVPVYCSANPKLGKWVSTQRSNYKLYQEGKPGPMTAERIRALDGIGFKWDTTAAAWNKRIGQLREFKVQFGHCLVPSKYPGNPKLGWWVSTQRSSYRLYQEGRPTSITAERIQELDEIGFKWDTAAAAAWNERLEELREFKVQFGHCIVPCKYPANPKLGWWASKQRYFCNLYQEGKPTTMTAERIRALGDIGFDCETAAVSLERAISCVNTLHNASVAHGRQAESHFYI
jgi:hypothetical protein